ncbi:MAG TPA: S53 family peptidase [Solirubrobacteraceae bacterium]|nr:S53 family peptidase [Solirubrobacteraceae bacterium]
MEYLVGSIRFIRASAAGAPRALLVVAVVSLSALFVAASASGAAARGATPPGLLHATRLGAVPAAQHLKLILPMKVDSAALRRFATAVSTPGSSLYGHFLSVAALSRRFGASPGARARVSGYLRARGATDVRIDATGLLAEATMSAGLAERMFAAPLQRFRANGTRFIAPTAPSSVPAPLRGLVDGVVGLDTRPTVSPARASAAVTRAAGPTARAALSAGSTLPLSGTPSGCPQGMAAGGQYPGFTPAQYLTAYGFGPLYVGGFTGQGVRVALIEIDGFNQADISIFAQCFGLPVPPISAFGAGVPNSLPAGEEATLDLEILDAAAPGLKAIDVYETNSGAAQTLAAFAAPLEKRGRKPQVISASLGLCEPDAYGASGLTGIQAAERLLQLAAASGVSILASSGDNGSADCQDAGGTPVDHLAVNYPASSWWVTGVGGTNLSLTAGNAIAAEPVWNDGDVLAAGGGGGFSDLFYRPAWQKGIVHPNHRAVPDVSMLADLLPGYDIYCTASPDCLSPTSTNPWQTVGGTSAGTPLLAGGVAIIDQMLRSTGHENLGLLNPLLYKLGTSSAAGTVFYDVTSGSNDIGPFIAGSSGQPLGCCTAAPGFDEASGWGSVSMAGLATQALALVPKVVKVTLSVPRGQRPVAHGRLLATVSCSGACSIGAFARVKIGSSKPFTVQSRLFRRSSSGQRTLPINFSGAELKQLRSGLSHRKRVVATLYGALIDQLGAIEQDTPGKNLVVSS